MDERFQDLTIKNHQLYDSLTKYDLNTLREIITNVASCIFNDLLTYLEIDKQVMVEQLDKLESQVYSTIHEKLRKLDGYVKQFEESKHVFDQEFNNLDSDLSLLKTSVEHAAKAQSYIESTIQSNSHVRKLHQDFNETDDTFGDNLTFSDIKQSDIVNLNLAEIGSKSAFKLNSTLSRFEDKENINHQQMFESSSKKRSKFLGNFFSNFLLLFKFCQNFSN